MSAIQRYVYSNGKTPLGGQNVINLNYLALPFQVSALVNIVSGAANYAIEYTHDDISGDPAYFYWVTDSKLSNQSASGLFLLDAAVTGLRLNLATLTGMVRFSVIQGVGTTI